MTLRQCLRAFVDWLADWQIVPVGFLAPVFLLADQLPSAIVVLALLAVMAVWGIHWVARGRFFTPTPVDIPLLILLVTLPVGVWAAAVPILSLPALLQYVFAVTLFYALVNSLTSERRVEWAGWAVLGATVVLVGVGLVGTAWGRPKFLPVDLASYIPHLIGDWWHSAGFHPHVLAAALAVLVPTTVAHAWATRTWPRRLILWLLAIVEIAVMVLTQSRGALLAFAIALLAVAISHGRRWRWIALVLVVAIAVGVALYGLQPSLELVLDTFGESAIQSVETRQELYSRGLYMLQDFPLTGVGLGMFSKVQALFYPLFLGDPGKEVAHMHNIYLQMGVDHGLPGLIAFLALVILLCLMAVQVVRLSRGRSWEPLAIGLPAGLAAYLVHGLVAGQWSSPRSHPILWGYFGLVTAVWCWATTGVLATDTDGVSDKT